MHNKHEHTTYTYKSNQKQYLKNLMCRYRVNVYQNQARSPQNETMKHLLKSTYLLNKHIHVHIRSLNCGKFFINLIQIQITKKKSKNEKKKL